MISKTDKLDYTIIGILSGTFSDPPGEDCLYCKASVQILKACKEAGLEFAESYVATTSKDGILPDTYTLTEEIETNDK